MTGYIDKAPLYRQIQIRNVQDARKYAKRRPVGLRRRLEHTGCSKCSNRNFSGLDSTLALLVTVKAFDALGLDRKGIHAVTMPGFRTTDRTSYLNAVELIKELGCDLRKLTYQKQLHCILPK